MRLRRGSTRALDAGPTEYRREAATDLRSQVVRGFGWKLAGQLAYWCSWTVVGILLARLLTPAQFGLASMVLIFTAILPLLSDLGLGAALVQRSTITEADRSTVFWTSIATGAALTALGIGISGPLASFYHTPAVGPLFAVLSLSCVITSLGATHNALMIREMNFRGVEIREICGAVLAAAAGLTAALHGLGAWSLIIQQLTYRGTSTTLLWTFYPWRPRATFAWSSLRNLGGFGGNVLGVGVLTQLNRNLDTLLIGRFLGVRALGGYNLASNVILLPFNRIATPIQEVLFPAFSRLQHEPLRMGSMWLRVNQLVAAISFPTLLGLVVVAPDFVEIVLGDRWRSVTPVLQILAWVGLLQSLQRLNPSVLQARDRTRTLLLVTCGMVAAGAASVSIGLAWGTVGVASAYAVSNSVLQPLYTWITARSLGLPLRAYAASLAGIAQATVVMVAGVVLTRMLLLHAGLGAEVRLPACLVVGASIFVPVCLWRAPETRSEALRLRAMLRRMFGPSPPAPSTPTPVLQESVSTTRAPDDVVLPTGRG
jgi:O-antigen/teichoic acid export membrane protein